MRARMGMGAYARAPTYIPYLWKGRHGMAWYGWHVTIEAFNALLYIHVLYMHHVKAREGKRAKNPHLKSYSPNTKSPRRHHPLAAP